MFFVIFILPFVLKSQVYTVPEFLERRYDGRARTYFSILNLFLNIVVDTAAGLYAGGLLLKLVFPDIPMWQTIAALALVAGVYTIAGGLAAVIYTDTIQTVLLLIGSIIISVTAFTKVGGWDAVVSQVPPARLSLIRPLDDPGVPWLGLFTGLPLLGIYFWCNNQFMVQRILSAKDLWHGRLGCLFAGLLKLPVLFIMVLPGTAAILLYPDLKQPDMVYPTLLFDLLPTGLLGLVMAGFLAALMSAIDSSLNSASTLVTLDFVAKAKPHLSQHKLIIVGRWVTLILMILAALWAPQIEKFGLIWKYLQSVLSYRVPPVVSMFLVGIFWKRANAQGAFLSLVVGVILGAVFFYLNEVAGVTDVHFLYIAPMLFVACTILLIVGSLAAAPPDKKQVAELTWTTGFYRTESAELRAVPWHKNYRILSAILTVITIVLVVTFR